MMRISKCQASTRSSLMSRMFTRTKTGVQSVEIPVMQKAFNALPRNTSVMLAKSLGTLPASATKGSKLLTNQRSPRHTRYKQGQYMQKKVPHVVNLKIIACDESLCLQMKVQQTQANLQRIPWPTHLITNLAYRLKSHHTRKLYLRARLDTSTDVNIMSTSVYRLVYKDPDMKKLDPSSLEIGTYTKDTVKIVGSCMLYLVNPDTKKLMDVTFYIAMNDGNILLSCKTTLMAWFDKTKIKIGLLAT